MGAALAAPPAATAAAAAGLPQGGFVLGARLPGPSGAAANGTASTAAAAAAAPPLAALPAPGAAWFALPPNLVQGSPRGWGGALSCLAAVHRLSLKFSHALEAEVLKGLAMLPLLDVLDITVAELSQRELQVRRALRFRRVTGECLPANDHEEVTGRDEV